MHLKEIQEYAQSLSKKEGWDKESLEIRLAYLKDELREALQEIDEYSKVTSTEDKEQIKQNLGLELFDIIWNVAELANRFNIDLEASAEQKMMINCNRVFSERPKKVNLS